MVLNPKFEDFIGQGMVSFSYDDGAMNNYDLGIPLHEEYNLPATFNIITSIVDGTLEQGAKAFALDYFGMPITRAQIIEMSNLGYEIAAHTHTHPIQHRQGRFLSDYTAEEVLYEYTTANGLLRKWGIPRIEGFAVPGSKWTPTIADLAKPHYRYVRSLGNRSVIPYPPTDPYNLPSFFVGGTTSVKVIKAKIDEAISQKKWLIIMMHGLTKQTGNVQEYLYSTERLEQIFQYIASKPEEQLLAVNQQDALRFITNLGDFVVDKISLSLSGKTLKATGFDEYNNPVPTTRGFNPKWSVVNGDVTLTTNSDGSASVLGKGTIRVKDANNRKIYSKRNVNVVS
ncbi:hypothetical protein CWR48_04050 [Oceanobacillus arenosus]|uniref:NodB homology domain-containing protein n=1 Tax=Oceanobacillus arenosus TaxID=1229153 RepID=A0A3D8PYA2_9BACI|nr:polysaccharide deacetylase family protein [Oceanobacillus arenosus]RDW21136.1 hypothetical protein CWR48_04050 [Oceanobacillus arenosus]